MMALVIVLIAGAVGPAAFLLHFVYVRDKYEREPLGLVLRVYFLSFFTVIPALILEALGQLALEVSGARAVLYTAVLSFGVVGVAEEGSKFLFLRWLAFHRREFSEVYDGILYAVAVSLGFATVENLLYVLSAPGFGAQIATIVVRALLAVPLHALAGVIMGYCVGRAKFTTTVTRRRRLLLAGFVIPAFAHGLYDFPLLLTETEIGGSWPALLQLGSLLIVAGLWVTGVKLIHRAQAESPYKRPSPVTSPLGVFGLAYKFCTQCGARALLTDRFCRACGLPHRLRN